MRRNNHKKFVNGGGKEVEVVAQNNFYHRIPMNILIIFIHNLKATKSAIDGCLVWGKVLRCRSRWWWERNLINYSILWDGGNKLLSYEHKKNLSARSDAMLINVGFGAIFYATLSCRSIKFLWKILLHLNGAWKMKMMRRERWRKTAGLPAFLVIHNLLMMWRIEIAIKLI